MSDRAWPWRVARWLPLLPACLVALLVLPAIAPLTAVASLSPFGRDQGIFHYEGWALLQGEVLYRDVRDVNGPLTAFVHAAAIAVGAADEVRFRTITLVLDALAFGAVGACLPGLAAGAEGRATRPRWSQRAAWAAAAVAILGAQYLTYDYWHSAQRETFCDWFMLPAVGLALQATLAFAGESAGDAARRQRRLLIASGALAVIPLFGKPTYALMAAVCLVAVLAPGAGDLSRVRRATWWCGGAAIAGVVMLGALIATGDLGAFVHVATADVPAMYRFIWPRSVAWFFSTNPRSEEMWAGVAGTAVLLVLLARGRMPRGALAVALLPAAAILAAIAQRKGFPYHHHPISAASRLQLLLLAAWATESAVLRGPRLRALAAAVVVTAGVVAVAWCDVIRSPHQRHRALLDGPRGPERETPAYFAGFPEHDFDPWTLRLAARWLAENTAPGDRVQVYGMDPYLLYLAGRRSATPYIYAYDLSVGAALAGGEPLRPSEEQAAAILALRDRHETDLLARLEASPPAAFVLVDRAPTLTYVDALADLRAWCPRTAAWLDAELELAAEIGGFRIYMPRAAP